ncbi:hypothetical protein O181_050181 [Austropuccinia psidii MF-1]|uniref:Uncharacterized protein n=1 Tax=Austropuccinia psidii MF-1 TaxID=1389203 RepID=A0A9Q3DTU4_9BASI|nr:hypothetical protein [Austropuccinia psidii MF-1]
MVHTRNGSSYSVPPDGPGQGRGKTRTRSAKSSSRKTHLEDARAAPIPQVPIQKLVQSSKRRGVGNMPKPLAGGMNSYLHIKSFLVQEKTIELSRGWSPLSCKEKVKKIKNWLENQSLLSVDQKKESKMTPSLEEGPVASTSSKPAPEPSEEKLKGPQKKKKGPKNH